MSCFLLVDPTVFRRHHISPSAVRSKLRRSFSMQSQRKCGTYPLLLSYRVNWFSFPSLSPRAVRYYDSTAATLVSKVRQKTFCP